MRPMVRSVLRRVSARFFLAFLLLSVLLTAAGGGLLLKAAGLALERELGERLTALAAVTAATLDARAVAVLKEGDEASPVHRYLRSRLDEVRRQAGARRIYIFTPGGESLVDTEDLPIGTPYGQFMAFKEALPSVREGRSYASPLYRSGGVQYKTGFWAVRLRERVVAGVAVEASARYLEVLDGFRKAFALILAAALALGGVVAYGLARSLSRPLDALIAATEDLRKGRMERPIALASGTEMDRLGEALELLRTEVLKRDRNLKMMLAQIAHEIKNPLEIYQLYLPLLSAPATTPEAREAHVRMLRAETAQLNRLLDEFIAFVRRKTPEMEPVAVADLFRRLAEFFREKAARQGVEIAWSVEGDPVVEADRLYLWHSLFNLVKNGLEAMPGGGLLAMHAAREDGWVRIEVRDGGSGIAPEVLPLVFDPFFTTKAQGSGLGLAVVAEYVRALGGEVRLEPAPERGTRAVLRLNAKEG
jgi:signal transduction histidine kinase